jgi:cold shock CspA family protein/ribosome-associated translation inhibitor RaiA
MQTPVQIDYHGASVSDHLREAVGSHVAALEKRFGRITACRVSVKAPTGHHKTGGPYEVSIHLALPNKNEVTVDRHASADERFADASFAVNDAFKRIRRRLQDRVRRMQGKVKVHEAAPLGEVIRLDRDDGFGFLRTPDDREIYFHRNSVLSEGFDKLEVGTRVAFAEEEGEKGPQASTVRIAGKHGLR